MTAVTCLIPAYNEAARISTVLAAVRAHPLVDRVVVMDDGSTDGTGDLARGQGVEVLRTPGNLGKTQALVMGLQTVTTPLVLLLDADLLGVTPADVSALIEPVRGGRAGASISLRGNAPRTWRMIGLDYISGERVIPHRMIADHLEHLTALPRFGFEVYLNRLLLAEGRPVAVVPWPGVASPSKASKRGRWAGVRADAAMMADIFRTTGPVECLRQIRGLRRLRA